MSDGSINDLLGISNPWLRYIAESPSIGNDLLGANPTPQALHNAYRSGSVRGVIVDDDESPWFIRRAAQYYTDACASMRDESLVWEESQVYRAIAGMAQEVGRVMQWKAWLKIDPLKALRSKQVTGDCVSHGIRAARDTLRCLLILMGRLEAYIERQATCGIYSGRGHNGQGASPVGLSAWAVKIGTLLEKVYLDGKYDFRDYNSYVRWGMSRGRSGMPSDLLELTKPYTDDRYYVAKTWEGFCDALAAGYTVHCGSNMGVSSYGDPVSNLSGSWAHDMAIMGVDITKEFVKSEVVFFDQSWGNWNRVENIPDAWKPWGEGMFCIRREDFIRRALSAGGTCVFVPGKYFPADPINNLLI
jgi:hypothetical protein